MKREGNRIGNAVGNDSDSHSGIACALVDAYRKTHYVVYGESDDTGTITLLIGVRSDPLAVLHKRFGVDCSAFITACNPLSRALSDGENAIRQEALLSSLKSRSLRRIGGIGQHPGNDWPGEPSVLVLGLSLESAKVLAQDYEQNAFVFAGADATPQLILLR